MFERFLTDAGLSDGFLINLALAFAGMIAYAWGAVALRNARQTHAAAKALLNRLDYEIVPVDADQAATYRLVLTTWRDFAERVLADGSMAAFHDQIRRDTARFRTEYAGFHLFVRVKCLPLQK